MSTTAPISCTRRLLFLESEAASPSALDQSYSEKDGTLRQDCADQGKLPFASSHLRLESSGRRRDSDFDQGISWSRIDHFQRALRTIVEPARQTNLFADDQKSDRQDESLR